MRKNRYPELAGPAKELRKSIERWRRTRASRSPMPAGLWRKAAMLARKCGVCPVARALRIDYKALSIRARASEAARIKTEPAPSPAAFVELRPSLPPPVAFQFGTVLELSDPGGAKLVIRIERGGDVDIIRLVNAFRDTSR